MHFTWPHRCRSKLRRPLQFSRCWLTGYSIKIYVYVYRVKALWRLAYILYISVLRAPRFCKCLGTDGRLRWIPN
ncbi:hypothetical protein EB796_011539 [Bugula neritina]|uniref:Uncharacterized protein n=1 Tax=Bugula neritina TaxID=10212 RepID=A0A7J7JWW0_BUGNE|nr:hypothetical protein EB796_011539 [Bugula neritina]